MLQGKDPLEVRKQCGKQISVNSHRNTFYTAEGKRELSFFFFFLRIEADQPDSYNISRVLIREKW